MTPTKRKGFWKYCSKRKKNMETCDFTTFYHNVLNANPISSETHMLSSSNAKCIFTWLNFTVYFRVNPLPNDESLDSSKLKEFADDNLKYDLRKVLQNGRKHGGNRRNCSLRAISRFYHGVFKRLVSQTRKKQGLVWERVKLSFFCSLFTP